MKSVQILGATAIIAALLSGCSNSGGHTASQAPPTSLPNITPTPTTSATQAAINSQSGAPSTIDPCELVTQQEASALAGTSFGPGKEESDGSNGQRRCIYGYQTKNVFL